MHASNLLKTVLKPQNPSSGKKSNSSRGVSFLDNTLPLASTPVRKSSLSSSSTSPAKMACLCAPTKHAGSFRCRLHRQQQQWAGRPIPTSKDVSSEDFESASNGGPVVKNVVSVPGPTPTLKARSPPRASSRLSRVVLGSQLEEMEAVLPSTNGNHLQMTKKIASNGAPFATTLGAGSTALRVSKDGPKKHGFMGLTETNTIAL